MTCGKNVNFQKLNEILEIPNWSRDNDSTNQHPTEISPKQLSNNHGTFNFVNNVCHQIKEVSKLGYIC